MANETKWTKGEWRVSESHPSLVVVSGDRLIIIAGTKRYVPVEEERANANLIATAPMLYNVLDSIVNSATDADGVFNPPEDLRLALLAGQAALRRAREGKRE